MVRPRNAAREGPRAGLCERCAYQRLVSNTRGSVFSLCTRSKLEPEAFRRYPQLPVTACTGFEERSA